MRDQPSAEVDGFLHRKVGSAASSRDHEPKRVALIEAVATLDDQPRQARRWIVFHPVMPGILICAHFRFPGSEAPVGGVAGAVVWNAPALPQKAG